jgi:hypothetical protein
LAEIAKTYNSFGNYLKAEYIYGEFIAENSLTMPVKTALLNLIQQMDLLLQQLSEEEYCRQLPEFDQHSIGQHFRHILEFFQCLEEGIAAGVIDYSERSRNAVYETQPAAARQAFGSIAQGLTDLDDCCPVAVRTEVGADHRPCYDSTIGRELVFTFEHAIHHLAIIKIGLRCHFPHICVDRHLGVAPSTLKAQRRSAGA